MIKLRDLLPFWLSGPETLKLADAGEAFFARWEAWVNEALAQADLESCTAAALDVHAWDRAVERLPGEPDALFRARVLHAFALAQLGGVRKGLDAALAYYGLVGFTVFERDVLFGDDTIRIEPGANPWSPVLLKRVLEERGRACRQYVVGTAHQADVYAGSYGAGLAYDVGVAASAFPPAEPVGVPATPAPFYFGAWSAGLVYSHGIAE